MIDHNTLLKPVFYFFLATTVLLGQPEVSRSQVKKSMNDNSPKAVTTLSGLKYNDTVVGSGTEATRGKSVSVHYTGWLEQGGVKGAQFDSSIGRGRPFTFPLGSGTVIAGWDEGVQGMKVGGKRTLHIPSELGYGSRGAGGTIPPNAALIFDVELLEVK